MGSSDIRKAKRAKAARLAASQLAGVQQDLDTCRHELERCRTSSKEVINERDELRTSNGELNHRLGDLRGLVSMHKTSITSLLDIEEQLEDALSKLNEELKTAKKRITSLEADDRDVKQLRSRLQSKQQTIDNLQKTISRQTRATANV